MIKFTLRKAAIILFFINTSLFAQTPAIISKPEPTELDYIVKGNVTLIATQSINLKPGTHIQTGSTFVAKIVPDAYIPFSFSNENYVFTRTFQKEITNSANISNNSDVIENVAYFDGLGRSMQNVSIKASPYKKDIVSHIGYDNFGKQDKDYLPYIGEGTLASYRSTAEASTKDYYISNYSTDIDSSKPNPFSQKDYDNSVLNRVNQQASPGKAWALDAVNNIKMDYQSNSANEVKLFTASTTWNSSLSLFETALGNSSGTIFYPIGQLFKTIMKDENWTSGNNNTTEEFKDKDGRVILKKTYGESIVDNVLVNTSHETYYVYDAYGNLTFVLPPKADGNISESVLNNLCYQYKYDHRGRLVEKKLPGKEWEYIIYDKLDRVVLTQDANLRSSNKWLFMKYDAFNRSVYTGEYLNTEKTSRISVQTLADEGTVLYENKIATPLTINTTSINYTNNAFPKTGTDLFKISYYDNYANIYLDGGETAVSYGITPITDPKGLSTCSKIRVLGTSNWITNVNYYNAKGRTIYTYSKNNYLTLIATAKTKLDFTGKPLETVSTHKKGADAQINITDVYEYDHTGRLLTQKQTINNQAQEVIAVNTYDNLGQLITKGVGGKTSQSRLQTVDYTYNIRGWLKGINNVGTLGTKLFAFQINYNTPTLGTPLFNGNISQTLWKTAYTDNSQKGYTYTYDNLNRLTKATDISTLNAGRYNESTSYDKNGNITNLTRLGHIDTNATQFGNMDILTYTYDTGNRLNKVEDTSGSTEGFNNGSNTAIEYTYDKNGNMLTDLNKGIKDIAYNHLNLPTKITFASGVIDYTYDATGVKQRKTVSTGGRTDYANSFIYENDDLKQFPQPEGYITYNAGIFNYIYQYKDHLGNIRLSYQDKDNNGAVNTSEIVQENNYYPFGLTHKGYNTTVNGVDNKYKYNGKELQDESIGENQLNWYDYGFRNYDPILGRWMNIDPLAEKFISESPYAYVNNDPMGYADFDGKDYIMTIQYDKNGKLLGVNISGTVYIQGDGASNKRAGELNKYAKKSIKGGEGVSVDINYVYDNSKNAKNLKDGENILTFNSEPEGDENTSHGNWARYTNKELKNRWLTGKNAVIFGSGKSNHAVLHETLHLFGLADRYDDYRGNTNDHNHIGSRPFDGFENNIMAEDSSNPSLHAFQYKQWFEHAKSRAKAHNNPNRIIGTLAVDQIGDFTNMPDGTRRKQMKSE